LRAYARIRVPDDSSMYAFPGMDEDDTREREAMRRELASLRARLDVLIDALVAAGTLTRNHERLIESESAAAASSSRREPVRLQVLDKYAVDGADIDCASRLELCEARCCSFEVTLGEQDLEEGGIAWELRRPYILRRERDGYCSHYVRGAGTCAVHERRPAECRLYDCRTDPRVWIDFDQRIPAPRPTGQRREP
jgi:Fe-S-cluster containining protein